MLEIASTARQIAQFAELCRTSNRSKGDPIRCAIAAYHGSWERPDYGFADAVRTIVAKDNAPDFEMPAGTAIDMADIGSNIEGDDAIVEPYPCNKQIAYGATPEGTLTYGINR
jgi:hypothetical protein